MRIFVCLLWSAINLYFAMRESNTGAWANWLAAGFCFGLSLSTAAYEYAKSREGL